MQGLTIERLAIEDRCWRDLVENGIGSTPFHNPAVVSVVAAAMEREAQGWGAWQDGKLIGGLVVLSSPRVRLTPVSAAAYNGPVLLPSPAKSVSSRDRHTSAVISALCGAVRAAHSRVELRMVPRAADVRELIAGGWMLRPTFTYRLAIDDIARAWAAVEHNRRRLIRRAETLGYTVAEVRGDSVRPDANTQRYDPSFADAISRLNRVQQGGYGLPADLDLPGWRLLLERLLGCGAARLFVACCPRGELVAFQLVTAQAGVAANLLTGSCPEHRDSGVNGWLRWRVCEVLHREGIRQLDLNGARPGASGRFKASFGGDLIERWELSFPSLAPSRGFSRRLIRQLTRLFRPTHRRQAKS